MRNLAKNRIRHLTLSSLGITLAILAIFLVLLSRGEFHKEPTWAEHVLLFVGFEFETEETYE